MNPQLNKKVNFNNAYLITMLFTFLMFSANLQAQDDLIKGILQGVDALNKQMLKITALSDEEENKIGDELDKKIMKDFDAGTEKHFNVKKIFEETKKHVTRKTINYRYSVLKDKTVNAFAIAGGKVYLLSGLLEELQTEDEVAFVIAHEIAHIELKHCVNKIQYSAIAAEIEPNLGEIVLLAYSIYSTPFSKYDEYEADDLGVELMQKAGYKKVGAIKFFEKLMELEKEYQQDKRDPLNDFISSHPTAENRIERIKNKK